MQPRILFTLLSVFILWLPSSLSWSNSSIVLPQDSFSYSISPYVAIYEDKTRQLSIKDIISLKYQLFFTPYHADSLKLGISDSNFWFRFSVTNPYDQDIEALFTLSDSDFDTVKVYQIISAPNHSRQYLKLDQTDRHRAIKGGMLQFNTVRITAAANSSQTYLLQLHSSGLITAHVALMSLDKFVTQEQAFFLPYGMTLGIYLLAALCFLYVLVVYRLRIAFYSLLLCMIIATYAAANLGILRLFFNVDGLQSDKLTEFSLGMIYLFYILAATSLTWRGRYKHSINRWLYATALLALPSTLVITLWFPQIAMPCIVLLLVIHCYAMGLLLHFARSTTPISQTWLLLGYYGVATGALLMLLTGYNFLAFYTLSVWGEMFIPLIVIASLMVATLYQLPTYRLSQEPKPLDGLEGSILIQAGQEMMTPINSLVGISELLNDTPLSSKQRELVIAANQASLELLHSAQQITDLGHLQEGQFELQKELLPAAFLFNKIIEVLHPEAHRKQVELVLNIQDLPEMLEFDYKRLYTALFNILKQAIIHSDHGEIIIKVLPYGSELIEGIRIQIQITNIMVRPEVLRASFSVMHQQGYHQRLSRHRWHFNVTRLLLKKLHATLEVESMTDRGASIGLALPLDKPIPYQEPTQPKHLELLINRSALIVDDSTSLRSMLENQFKRWGLKVQGSYSPKEALARLRTQSNLKEDFDFVIIDHDLPLLDALQLATRIQQDAEIIHKPMMLMLCNHNIASLKEAAEHAGFQQILAKPINTEHLLQALLKLAQTNKRIDNDDSNP